MFQKIEKPCLMYPMPEDIVEQVYVEQPDSEGCPRIEVKLEHLSDRTKKQLKPAFVTLQLIIESGNVIDPGSVGQLLNISDVSDIEVMNGQMSENMYKYLLDHKEEIINSQKPVSNES